MKLASHYIFLKKENKKPYKNEDGVLVLDLPTGVKSYLTKAFPSLSPVPILNDSIYKRSYNAEFCISDIVYKVELSQYDVGKSTYLDIEVEGKTKVQIINCL